MIVLDGVWGGLLVVLVVVVLVVLLLSGASGAAIFSRSGQITVSSLKPIPIPKQELPAAATGFNTYGQVTKGT